MNLRSTSKLQFLPGCRQLSSFSIELDDTEVCGVSSTQVWKQVLDTELLKKVKRESADYHTKIASKLALQIDSQATQWLAHDASPRCSIESVIINALMPLAVHQTAVELDATSANRETVSERPLFAGAEWWVQHRAPNRSLGFHFDVDSGLMTGQDKRYRTPSTSSIFYLTDSGGPTVVLNQRLANGYMWGHRLAPGEATSCDIIFPEVNQFCMFPGHRLHGVMPSSMDSMNCEQGEFRTTLLINWWFGEPPSVPCCSPLTDLEVQKLTSPSSDLDECLADATVSTSCHEFEMLEYPAISEPISQV